MRSMAVSTHGRGLSAVQGILAALLLSCFVTTLGAQGGFSHSTVFGTGAMLPVGNSYGYSIIAVDDLNTDGHLDLAIAVPFFMGVFTVEGDGTGAFDQGNIAWAGAEPLSVITADLNEDGRPDIVTCNGARSST